MDAGIGKPRPEEDLGAQGRRRVCPPCRLGNQNERREQDEIFDHVAMGAAGVDPPPLDVAPSATAGRPRGPRKVRRNPRPQARRPQGVMRMATTVPMP